MDLNKSKQWYNTIIVGTMTFRKDLPRIVKEPQYTQFYGDLMVRQKFRRTLK